MKKITTYFKATIVASLVTVGFFNTLNANVVLTVPTLTVQACNGTFATPYYLLGTIKIAEGSVTDFSRTVTANNIAVNNQITFTAPAGFQFQAGVGNVSHSNGVQITDITSSSISVTSTTFVITYFCGSTAHNDNLTVTGLKVRATAASTGSSHVTYTANSDGFGISGLVIGNSLTNFSEVTYTVPATGTIVAPSISNCAGIPVTISGTGANSYTYTGGIVNGLASTPSATATYTITGTQSNGCTSTNTVTITVLPVPTLTNATSDIICSGATVNIPLTSSTSANYTWIAADNTNTTGESTGNQTTSTLSNTIINSTPLSQTVTYSVVATAVSGGCTATQTISVTVNPMPVMTNITTTTVCSGTALNFSLTSDIASSYTWLAADNANTTGESTTSQLSDIITNTIVNSTTSGQTLSYTVTPTSTAGVCVGNTQTVSVTVNPKPTMTSASSASICSGNTVNILLTSSITSTFSWHATSNGNITGESSGNQSSSTLNNTLINTTTAVQTVVYTITPTSTGGTCAGNSQTVNVTVNPSEDASFSYSTSTFCQSGANPSATIAGLSGGTFSAPSGLLISNTSTGLINLSGSTLGTYIVTYTTVGSCPNSSTFNVTITTLPASSFSYSATSYCVGSINPLPVFGLGASGGTFTSNPAGLVFVSSTTGEIDITASPTGTYAVTNTIPAAGGCASSSSSFPVSIHSLPVVSFTGLLNATCFNGSVSNLVGNPSGGTFTGGGVSGNSFNPSVAGAGSHIITYTYTDANTCTKSITNSTQVFDLPSAPDICEVTVDDIGTNNVVYWDKTGYTNVDSFVVYRETSLNNFRRIGAVPFDSLSQFIDTVSHLYPSFTGNPDFGTNKYKLQILDTCGNYSSLSNWQKTIFVNQTGGVFTFNDYSVEGQPSPLQQLISYQLWRDDNNTGAWNLLTSNASSPINDPSYASYPNGSWRILTDWTISCTPTRNNIHTTRSNIKRNATTVGIEEFNQGIISLFPNPAESEFTVSIQGQPVNENHPYFVEMADVLGKVVLQSLIKTQSAGINIENLNKGMYFVKVKAGEGAVLFTQRVIKE